jgi:signal transduction histidine kinase
MTVHQQRDEVDILYAASNKLTRASTPAEWLEAVSDYARDQGAVTGALFYTKFDEDGQPEALEMVADWSVNPQRQAAVGLRYTVEAYGPFYKLWLSTPDRPLLISDIDHTDVMDDPTRETFTRHGTHSAALLSLNGRGKWVGAVMFYWSEPYVFDERDQRIFTAMIQLAGPVMESVRLFEELQERAARAEHLLKVNTALSHSTTAADILDALALYARDTGAWTMTLNFLDVDLPFQDVKPEMPPIRTYTVAIWQGGSAGAFDPNRTPLVDLDHYGFARLWINNPGKVLFIDNIETDPRLADARRKGLLDVLKSRAIVSIPLHSGGRYQGLINIGWTAPHPFSDEEKYVYDALVQTISAVVASRRAYMAEEEARRESELLYRASKGINAATSFREIVEAVVNLDLIRNDVVLSVWQHYDYHSADYLEVVAKKETDAWPLGYRMMAEDVTLSQRKTDGRLMTVEDTDDRSQLDEQTAARLREQGYRAFITVPLLVGDRLTGNLSFMSRKPTYYSEREKRLATGIGDLVAASLERMRLKEKTDLDRQQAQALAQASALLSQATDEQSILAAVAGIAEQYRVSLSLLAYLDIDANDALQAINIVALRSGDGRSPLPLSFLPVRYLSADDYPILQVAYENPHEPIFIEDLMTDPRTLAGRTRSFSRQLDWGSVVLIPLKTNDQWQGILTFVWEKPQHFGHELRNLIEQVRAPATAVVTSRRAYLAEEEARRETELLYRASKAINAAKSLPELAAAISQFSLSPTGVNLGVWENYSFDGASYIHVIPGSAWPEARFPKDAFNLSHDPRNEIEFVENIAEDGRIDQDMSSRSAMRGVQAMIHVPLTLSDRWMGSVMFMYHDPTAFTAREKRLAAGIGDLATAALERIRLKEFTDLRVKELETVARISAVTTSILSLDDLLKAIVELIQDSFGLEETYVYLADETRPELLLAAGGDDEIGDRPVILPLDESAGPIGQAATTQRGVIANHMQPNALGLRTEMAVPMIVGDTLVGVLNINAAEANRFGETDLRLMTTLADLIAVAVQNARLYEQAQELAALEERNRLARELHDSVSQALYGIALGTRTARVLLERDPKRLGEPLEYVMSLAEAGLTEMRALIFELRPEFLENEGLLTALRKQAASVQARHGVQVAATFCDDEPQAPLPIKEALYRIGREALHNIVKHANASKVTLDVRCEADAITLELTDNGVGFDTGGEFPGHLGLKSMRERAARLNGVFEIESVPGQGTRIYTRIPLAGGNS